MDIPSEGLKCRVTVVLKKSVFDPQGSAIERSLQTLGVNSIESVRQGKIFEITLRSHMTREDADTQIKQIAKDVLSNPVIEAFHIEFI